MKVQRPTLSCNSISPKIDNDDWYIEDITTVTDLVDVEESLVCMKNVLSEHFEWLFSQQQVFYESKINDLEVKVTKLKGVVRLLSTQLNNKRLTPVKKNIHYRTCWKGKNKKKAKVGKQLLIYLSKLVI